MKTTTTNSIFAADPEGFREQQAGRPAAHLVREAIQNAWDEPVSEVQVELTYDPAEGAHLVVTDDAIDGITDERLIWTIWLSGKTDHPQKRGRMGRGLKELIAVSDRTLIVSRGCPAILFERSRGKWTRSSPRKVRPEKGTVVDCQIKIWKKKDVEQALDYLRRMRPPSGMTFTINGQLVTRATPQETYQLKLPTIVYEQDEGGRVMRERKAEAPVELFAEPEPYLYEMGIPVEAISYPLSIDVGQRVPLREKRDTVTEAYRRELFARLLDLRVQGGLVADEQLRDNFALVAAQASEHLSKGTQTRLVNAWTAGKPFATTPQTFSEATGMHVPAVSLRGLPESIRDLARLVGTDVRDVMADMRSVLCKPIEADKQTAEQRLLVKAWEWLARGANRPCRVELATGRPSAGASFNRESQTVTVYVENIGGEVLRTPLSAAGLRVLIHELSHWSSHGDEHGADFHSDAEYVGAKVAVYLMEHAEEARELVNKEG